MTSCSSSRSSGLADEPTENGDEPADNGDEPADNALHIGRPQCDHVRQANLGSGASQLDQVLVGYGRGQVDDDYLRNRVCRLTLDLAAGDVWTEK
jgi:hypothetical protein